jgi:2,3-bisphosphoglycerate-independent phosphoglycerate mutase
MRTILIIGDGMADRPLPALGGQTPLQVAATPALDALARRGICGIVDPIAPGIPGGSDTAHLALLGYDPYTAYDGRGAYEALGAGLEVRPGDVAFRGNLATVDDAFVVRDRRAGRIRDGAARLVDALQGVTLDAFPEVQVFVTHTVEHRCAIVLRGPDLSQHVSDTDPHVAGVPLAWATPVRNAAAAGRTAEILNAWTRAVHARLHRHTVNVEREAHGRLPANAVLLRGAGVLPDVPTLTELYGVRGLVVAAGASYKGVGMAVGMEAVRVPGATGRYDTDPIAKARAAVDGLQRYEFLLIHVKATDSASHDGDAAKKRMMVEKVDALVAHLLQHVDPDETFLAVTADHTTSTALREHVGDPVPVAILGPGVRTDAVQRYAEVDCATGGLNRIRGVDVMPILMDLVGRTTKYGA